MSNKPVFKGFSEEIFGFLSDLEKNNNVEWFRSNRSRYDKYLVEPAREFITELGPFLNKINPAIRTEPKFNKTIMRINKDMRFAKGAPYKTYFLIHFGRFKLDSEYFLYFSPNEVQIGLFLNNTAGDSLHFKKNIKKYKNEIVNLFEKYKLNNRFSFYKLNKEPELIQKKLNAEKHIDLLEKCEYILLQKVNPPKSKIFTDDLLPYSVKLFYDLYPLLCFSYFPNPLKEVENFEENFGIVI